MCQWTKLYKWNYPVQTLASQMFCFNVNIYQNQGSCLSTNRSVSEIKEDCLTWWSDLFMHIPV